MSSQYHIRQARPEDANALLAIYTYYVLHTAVTFDTVSPTVDDFVRGISSRLGRYPYLVVEQDNKICGYAYASPFIGRAAYQWSCEVTIYLDPSERRKGYGRALYSELEKRLKAMGIVTLYACIGLPDGDDPYLTTQSADFHEACGYRRAGMFPRCGNKLGRWYHMVWMQKRIGNYKTPPDDIQWDKASL